MKQHENATADPVPFAASEALLRASPRGLVQMATDWLAQTRGGRRFEVEDPRFKAAGAAMRAAPEVFVAAAGDDSWEDLKLGAFWALYFDARRLGTPPAPLLEVLAPLDKAQLGKGAKDMMIVAARARDGVSFGELLDLGAVRRSKLVMISAYQHGGRDVASQVKMPTGKEALEMLGEGMSRYSWRRRDMVHDQAGFHWLMELIEKPIAALDVAVVGATSPEPRLLEEAVASFYDKMLFPPRAKDYHHPIEGTQEEADAIAVMAFASAGSAKAAKALAIARGGQKFWRSMCSAGIAEAAALDFLPVRAPQSEVRQVASLRLDANVKKASPKESFMTVQAAACLSRVADECEWLRREYKEMGVAWMDPSKLAKLYAPFQSGHHHKLDAKGLADQAVAISELADLRADAAPAEAAPQRSARPRSRAL